jgi:predicted oxidoreductase
MTNTPGTPDRAGGSAALPPTDVLIVGGGISALVAAAEIAGRGKSVTILERRPRPELGGQARDAFGGIFLVGSPEQRRVGIRDSVDLAWADWQGYAEFAPHAVHQRSWARRYIERCVPDVREYLVGKGLGFVPVANWAERAADGRGNRVPRFHLLWGCGPGLVAALLREVEAVEASRVTIRCEHRVDGLIVEGGAVVGVRGQGPDGAFEARAEHVVIAGGGRTGDLAKVRASWPQGAWGSPPDDLLAGVWPHLDGRLHDAAADVGASLTGLDNMWVYAAGITHLDAEFDGHGLAIIPPKSALWLQADGGRVTPPLLGGYDTREAVARICTSKHPWSWLVLNRRILAKEIAVQSARFNPAFRDRRYSRVARDLLFGNKALAALLVDRSPDVVSAPDLTALALRMMQISAGVPIDAAALSRTVTEYDAEIGRGKKLFTDAQLVSLRNIRAFLGDRVRLTAFAPIAAGPPAKRGDLVAIRVRPVVRKTLGGIETDLSCRVVRPDGSVVPGLYAIGEAAGFGGGGMNGKRTLEGTLLGGCIFTARELARQLP